jgi:hypothetical protein
MKFNIVKRGDGVLQITTGSEVLLELHPDGCHVFVNASTPLWPKKSREVEVATGVTARRETTDKVEVFVNSEYGLSPRRSNGFPKLVYSTIIDSVSRLVFLFNEEEKGWEFKPASDFKIVTVKF